jgi:hypothetical protein
MELCRLFVVLGTLLVSVFSAAQSDFSIILLPDTQNYSQYHPAIFKSQTNWIVNNAASLNVQMVIGEGDIVNHDSSSTEWSNAVAAADVLNNEVRYTFAIGNHDYDGQAPAKRQATHFNSHFGPQRYASYSWYGGNYNGSNENFYTFFSGGGEEYIVLSLEYYPRSSVLDWVDSVLSSYSNKKAIVVTHSFEGTDGFRVDRCDTNDISSVNGNTPEYIWEKVLKFHSNIVLIVSGHLIGSGTAHRTDLGANGNLVHQIFTNFQSWTNGGNGYLRILTFHPNAGTISVRTYSPYLNNSLTSGSFQFSLPLKYGPTATTGQFKGKVRNTSCTKLAGATVSTGGYTATTSSNGTYTLGGLPAPQGYGVTANASGYAESELSSSAEKGLSTQLNFYLSTSTTQSTQTQVNISSPASNSTVSSPLTVSASATASSGTSISWMAVYLDGVKKYGVTGATLKTGISASSGSHKVTVQAKDSSGTIIQKSINIAVQ